MNMIADSADIKFACSQCGQHIVVDKSAAGLTANCPICNGSVTVPHESIEEDRHFGAAAGEIFDTARAYFSEEPQEYLTTSAPDHGKGQRELDEAKKENERLRALFKKAVDECERITANATHAQAEVKSFQSDRQQLKSELSQARQRAATAETQVGILAAALAKTNEEANARQEQLALALDRLATTENQVAEQEHELSGLRAENSEVVRSLADAQSELAAFQIELTSLRQEQAASRKALDQSSESERRLGAAKQDLESRLEETTVYYQKVVEERHQLHQQIERLRQDLVGTESGRELVELRHQLTNLTEAHERVVTSLAEKTAEGELLAATAQDLRTRLKETRQLWENAERLAAANSEAQLNKDNDVLRGIVERQNATLGEHFSELRRLRRARLAVRAIYGVFGIGLIALFLLALSIFNHRGVGDLLNQLGP